AGQATAPLAGSRGDGVGVKSRCPPGATSWHRSSSLHRGGRDRGGRRLGVSRLDHLLTPLHHPADPTFSVTSSPVGRVTLTLHGPSVNWPPRHGPLPTPWT